jgi:hypothetical protein
MKKNELENRLAEVEDVLATIEKTLGVAIDEVKRAETVKEETTRILVEVANFVKHSLENLSKVSDSDKEKALEESMRRLLSWSQAESDRMRIRPQALQERVAALQSVTGWLGERGKSHKGRIDAIVRAADPERDKRRPEKLSVRRAAQELTEDDTDDE